MVANSGEIPTVPITAHVIDEWAPTFVGQPDNRALSKEEYYIWYNKLSEMYGIISALCNDTLGDSIEFRGTDADVKKAQDFARKNHFRKRLYSVLQDYFLIGDGYLGMKVLDKSLVAKKMAKLCKSEGYNYEADEILEKLMTETPETFEPREIFVLKTKNISINYNKHGIVESYVQKVKGIAERVQFRPDEVVHLSLNNIGDDVYGNSPWASAWNDVATLWYVKDYAGTFFENDARPDIIWNLQNTTPKSEEYKKFVQQLKEYQKSRNKHKSMVTTGETSFQRVNEWTKDMEFPNLMDKMTQRLLMIWNMPMSRLSSANKDAKDSKESNAAYYKNINRIQEEIEETLNSELWVQFGEVEMKFKRAYKRDDSIEADIVSKIVGQPVMTPNEGRAYLGLSPSTEEGMDEVKTDFKEEPDGPISENVEGDDSGNQFETSDEKKKFAKAATLDITNFAHFEAIVTKDQPWAYKKVFYEETDDTIKLFYNDTVGSYSAIVVKEEIEDIDFFKEKYLSLAIPVKASAPRITIDGL